MTFIESAIAAKNKLASDGESKPPLEDVLAKDYYFKTKPMTQALVSAISTIKMPLFKPENHPYYPSNFINHYYPLPRCPTGFAKCVPRLIANTDEDGVLYDTSEGAPWDKEMGSQGIVNYLDATVDSGAAGFQMTANAPWDPNTDFTGFRTPEEAWGYRYGGEPFTGAHFSSNAATFQSIFCEWDRYKFANFIIESLVGKALLQALTYNYCGYPMANVGRMIDQNPLKWKYGVNNLGRMPNFGHGNPTIPIPEENLGFYEVENNLPTYQWNGVGNGMPVIGGFDNDALTFGNAKKSISGQSGFKPLGNMDFRAVTGDSFHQRYYSYLGMSREGLTGFGLDEDGLYTKNYTNSYVYEVRGFPGVTNYGGGFTPTPDNDTSYTPNADGASGYQAGATIHNPKLGEGQPRYKEFSSGECPDTNYLSLKLNTGTEPIDITPGIIEGSATPEDHIAEAESPEYANKAFAQPYQPLTKTHAQLWFPSLRTATYPSPLSVPMGSPDGMRMTDWYYNKLDMDQISNIPTEGPAQEYFDSSFKTNNLVSKFKLVPYFVNPNEGGISVFLDNPHYTLNAIAPHMLKYLTQVVPKNPRYAGPKPATEEPDSRTERYEPLGFEVPWNATTDDEGNFVTEPYEAMPAVEYEDGGTVLGTYAGTGVGVDFQQGAPFASWLDTQRVVSGSFFEFQVGRKWANAPILARDPRREKPAPNGQGGMISNTSYQKLSTPEVGKYSNYVAGKVGINAVWIDAVPQKNVNYATKFGLWNNDWIGATPTKYWQKDGTYQPINSETKGTEPSGKYHHTGPGGFMLLPKNAKTIESMIATLPSLGLGRKTLSQALSSDGVTPLAVTKMLSDMWLSYNFATKPNGMGFTGKWWSSELSANTAGGGLSFIDDVTGIHYTREAHMAFSINRGMKEKINVILDNGAGQKDYLYHVDGSQADTTQDVLNDNLPLLFREGQVGADGTILKQPFTDLNRYQTQFAGYPAYTISAYLNGKYTKEEVAKLVLRHPYKQSQSAQKLITGKGHSAAPNKIVEDALMFDLDVEEFFDKANVPFFVNRFSIMEFPIWTWSRGGGQGYCDLDDVQWTKLINVPAGAGSGDDTQYTEDVYEKWKPYIAQNPTLKDQKRECVPRWIHSLAIYPTVKDDALMNGLVPTNLPLGAQTLKYTGQLGSGITIENGINSNYSYEKYSNNDGYGTQFENTGWGSAYTRDFYVIGEPGEGLNQFGSADIVAQFQKTYIDGLDNGITSPGVGLQPELKTYKKLSDPIASSPSFDSKRVATSCKPWMTLQFQRENNLTSPFFRHPTCMPYVELSYAVELEINEPALIMDLVKQGVVGLAGESAEYVALGMDLTQLMAAAFVQGGKNLYSDSLKAAYSSYEASVLGDPEFAGVSFDFGNFPVLSVSQDLTTEKVIKIFEGIGRFKEANKTGVESIKPSYRKKLEDNYEHIENVPVVNAPISSYIWARSLPDQVPIYSAPARGSSILGFVNNFSTVKVLKEWVNGGKKLTVDGNITVKGEWNKIQIVDPTAGNMDEVIGFIEPVHLTPITENIFLRTSNGVPLDETTPQIYDKKQSGLSKIDGLSTTQVKPMSEMAKALIPTWWKMQEPYYHRGDGEYWITVELKGENCIIDENDLDDKKDIALRAGIKNLFEFYSKSYTQQDIENMATAYLVSRVEDYHLDLRPGSSVKFLIKVGAIYFNAFTNIVPSLNELREKAPNQLTLNQKYYIEHINQALFSLNRMYLEIFASKYALKGVDLLQEMKRLEFVPTLLKKMMAVNAEPLGIIINSTEENTIELGLDKNYNLVYVAYKAHDETKFKILYVGFEHFKNLTPLNNSNTMSLLYHHRLLRNPMLKWQDAIKLYFHNPKPEIVEKDLNNQSPFPSAPCKPFQFVLPRWEDVLGPIASQLDKALQLDPRFDLGSFQFSLLKYFPPCPKLPSGQGDPFLIGEFDVNGEKHTFENLDALTAFGNAFDGEKIQEYVGDWLASSGALEDIQNKIIDLDDLWEYVLDYIDPPTLYAKICKCFLDQIGIDTIKVPNLELDASAGSAGAKVKPNLGSSALSGENQAEIEAEIKGPSASVNTDPKELAASDLICSFCMEIPSFFLRLPTTNILDELLNALLAVLEFILAQLLLALIKALLDLLLSCPEITCPVGEKRVKDYGGQDMGDIFSDPSLPDLSDYFSECGILIDGDTVRGDDVLQMMSLISDRLSSGEVLSLLGGGITETILNIAEEEISKFPEIAVQLNNKSRIEDFFTCAGLGLPKQKLADIENDIVDKYENPEICSNLLADAKAQLSDRCGVSDLYDASAKRALDFDLDKYKALADAIRENQDLSAQMPPLFGDCKGNQGVLSGLPNPTMDHAINKTVEQITMPIKNSLNQDLKRLRSNIMVSKNPRTEEILNDSLPQALFKLLTQTQGTHEDKLFPAGYAGFYGGGPYQPFMNLKYTRGILLPVKDKETNEVVKGIDELLENIEQNIEINKPDDQGVSSVVVKVDDNSQVRMELLPPEEDEDGNLGYQYNMETKVEASNLFGAKSAKQVMNLTNLDQNPDQKIIPLILKNHLEEYPLDKNSNAPPQAQYFANLIISNIQAGDFKLSEDNVEIFKNIFSDNIYWSVWASVFDTLGETIANAELLGHYEIDKEDDILNGFDPLMLIPGLALIFAAAAAAEELAGGSFDNSFIAGLYQGNFLRKEMTRLQLETDPQAKSPNGAAGSGAQLIDFEVVTKLIQDNYDFSQYHDPNSDQMGMPHYALLSGLLNAFIQLFIGEMYIRAIIPLSKLPVRDILLQDDTFAEFVYKEMHHHIVSFSPEFEDLFADIVESQFRDCSNSGIPYVADAGNPNPDGGFPGTAKSMTAFGEKNTYITDWKGGLRYLIQQNVDYPIPYIQNKLNKFRTKNEGLSIGKLNPVQAVSYPLMLQVYDDAFVNGVENVSLGSDSRMELFKNGKFFFQYYFHIEDWEPGDENYIESLVNRDPKFKGILSEDNFVDLISLMCGIPSLYPPNTPQVQPLVAIDGNDPSNIEVENTGPLLSEMFKEINFGIRWCYGAVTTEDTDDDGKPLIENQIEPVKEMFNALLTALDLQSDDDFTTAQKILSQATLQTGNHQTKEMNDYINYVNETKALLLIENRNIQIENDPTKSDEEALRLSLPMFSLVLPLFDERIKINNPHSTGGGDAYDGGYKFLDNGILECNYKASEIKGFMSGVYGKKVVQKVIDGLTSNPAYEGVLSYSFPIPKMCNMMMMHSVLVASRSDAFKNAFLPTKLITKSLMLSLSKLVGRDQYTNDFKGE